jgi:hypothetical protein
MLKEIKPFHASHENFFSQTPALLVPIAWCAAISMKETQFITSKAKIIYVFFSQEKLQVTIETFHCQFPLKSSSFASGAFASQHDACSNTLEGKVKQGLQTYSSKVAINNVQRASNGRTLCGMDISLQTHAQCVAHILRHSSNSKHKHY